MKCAWAVGAVQLAVVRMLILLSVLATLCASQMQCMTNDNLRTFELKVEHPHPLWPRLYPNSTMPTSLQQLPACFKDRKVFVYDLPNRFHIDLLDEVERTLNSGKDAGNCNWAREPCKEHTRNGVYSTKRQFTGEVPILAKLLLLPRTQDPSEADLFVVPYLGWTSIVLGGNWFSTPPSEHRVQELLPLLTHFTGDNVRRHVFLVTTDFPNIGKTMQEQVAAKGAIVLTVGPRDRMHTGSILVPSLDPLFGFSPAFRPKPSLKTFMLIGGFAHIPVRRTWYENFHAPVTRDPRFEAHKISGRKEFLLTPEKVVDKYNDAQYCPFPPGDFTHGHRFFDMLAGGCVPLVVPHYNKVNPGSDTAGNETCLSYYYNQHYDKLANTCVEQALPFTSLVNWREVVMEVPLERLQAKTIAAYVDSIDPKVTDRMRRRAYALGSMVKFDWSGRDFDMFSATLNEVCVYLKWCV